MEELKPIGEPQLGSEVASRINGNMDIIAAELSRIDGRVSTLEANSGGTTPVEPVVTGVVISANPEAIVREVYEEESEVIIPVEVYAGNITLSYTGTDDGTSTFKAEVDTPTISDSGGLIASVSLVMTADSKLNLKLVIQPNRVANFSLTFAVQFRNVKYRKTISCNVIAREGQSALSVELSPSSIILEEGFDQQTPSLTNAWAEYRVYHGSVDVTNDVVATVSNLASANCNGKPDELNHRIVITKLVENYTDGISTFEWTNLNGSTETREKIVFGYLTASFTYTANGVQYSVLKKLSFAVNYLGTFKESIVYDVHQQVSARIVYNLTKDGLLLTEEQRTEILQSAKEIALTASSEAASGSSEAYYRLMSDRIEQAVTDFSGHTSVIYQTASGLTALAEDVSGNTAQIAINASGLTSLAEDVSGNTSMIQQTSSAITLVVSGLSETGINIEDGNITLSADTTSFVDSNGNKMAMFTSEGGLNTNIINASDIVAKRINVSSSSGSVYMDESGILKADKAQFTNVVISGSTSNPFVNMEEFFDGKYKHDNFNLPSAIHITEYGTYPDDCLSWDMSQSGSRIVFLRYQYAGSKLSGTSGISVPEDKYDQGMRFFEDGILKREIKVSREIIELVGLSDIVEVNGERKPRFLGYAVLSRNDIETTQRYGHDYTILAKGHVTDMGVNYIRTFDGETVNVSHDDNTGIYTLGFSNTWFSENRYPEIIVSPRTSVNSDNVVTPITSSVYDITRNGCKILTWDVKENKAKDAAFDLLISNGFDWSTLP